MSAKLRPGAPPLKRAAAVPRGAISRFLCVVLPSGPLLLLLGGTQLRGVPPADADRLLAQAKAVALLAYLALAPRDRYVRRDRLVGLFWPELDQAHARGALRKIVHAIRSTLGPDAILARSDEDLALAPDALWCDATEFTAAADAGQAARALELYRGDLLDGFHLPGCADFGMWLDGERTAALERAAAAALALSNQLESEEQLTLAGQWARRAVRFAWSNERVLRRALLMLDRLGDRGSALHLYDGFARRLKSELEAEPSAETLALVAELRRPKPAP
jgi:DNA-binding SARP family transcriptional activator